MLQLSMQVGWLGDGDDYWAEMSVLSFQGTSLRAVDGGMDATGWDGERLRSSGNDRATPAGGPLRSFLRSGRAADRQMVTGPGNVACFQ